MSNPTNPSNMGSAPDDSVPTQEGTQQPAADPQRPNQPYYSTERAAAIQSLSRPGGITHQEAVASLLGSGRHAEIPSMYHAGVTRGTSLDACMSEEQSAHAARHYGSYTPQDTRRRYPSQPYGYQQPYANQPYAGQPYAGQPQENTSQYTSNGTQTGPQDSQNQGGYYRSG